MTSILRCHDIDKTDFQHARNCTLVDSLGRCYTDLASGIWCTALGHNHPRLIRAMQAQIDQLIHLGTRYPSQHCEEAATALLPLLGLTGGKCLFLSSGSEAVECAVQAARRATGRDLCLSFASSYFGSYGAAAKKAKHEWLTIDWRAYDPSQPLSLLQGLPFPDIAAFVFEPGGSSSELIQFSPQPLVEAIAERVAAAGGLVVANEITTGMGRTGRYFGFQHYDLVPDLIAVGKGLGNGYPVSAVAVNAAVAARLEATGFRYVQSHQNDPLGAVVAREVITEMVEGGWVARGAELGRRFLTQLQEVAMRRPAIKEVRGRGMLLGIELHSDWCPSAIELHRQLLARGFLLNILPAGNLLRLDPALTIEEELLTAFLDILDELLTPQSA
jgi:acetylornithine/N-succinyldiaminopimelate aminotransferase